MSSPPENEPDPSQPADTDKEDIESPEKIVEPFDPTKINIVRESMSVFQVMRKIAIDEIKLDPDFQRNIVWDPTRQSRLIESVLLRIPLPAFYLDAIEPNQWLVVDGLQRLYTLDSFCNKKALRLTGLEFLSRQLEGMNFDSLPRSSRRDIEETQLTLYIIRPETPPKVKFTIFYRINTGGMVLTAQEIRHATFPGRAPNLLRELALSDEFLKATFHSVNAKRMDDRECVLRHLAFRINRYTSYVKPDLNDFLGTAMMAINEATGEQIDALRRDFLRSMCICHDIFGKLAFRKFNESAGMRGPINKALFETWSTAVLDFPPSRLLANSDAIVEAVGSAFVRDSEYVKSLSFGTGGVNPVRMRFSKAYQLIDSILQP